MPPSIFSQLVREAQRATRARPEAEDGNPWLTAKTANGVELIFIKQESRPGNTPIVVFEMAEGGIDDVVSELAGKGVTIVTPVSHAPGGWSAEFKDPEGHVLSIYQTGDKPRKRRSAHTVG